jgi:hypothetical protein
MLEALRGGASVEITGQEDFEKFKAFLERRAPDFKFDVMQPEALEYETEAAQRAAEAALPKDVFYLIDSNHPLRRGVASFSVTDL